MTQPEFDWGDFTEEYVQLYSQENFVEHTYEKFCPVKRGDVVLDIGANYGAFTSSILHVNPSRVICVEPVPEIIPYLIKNVSKGNVNIINKAVTDVDSATTVTFSTLMSGLPEVDFLKFDCEGGEYHIFTETNADLIKSRVKYAAGEWHVVNFYDKEETQPRTTSADDFLQFRDLYLTPGYYKVFDRLGNDYTELIRDDARVRDTVAYMWQLYDERCYIGQFMVYFWQ